MVEDPHPLFEVDFLLSRDSKCLDDTRKVPVSILYPFGFDRDHSGWTDGRRVGRDKNESMTG